MLNIKTTFDKNSFYKTQKDALLLVELIGNNVTKKATTKRQKLNASLCIDISGSMNEPISRQPYSQPVLWNNSRIWNNGCHGHIVQPWPLGIVERPSTCFKRKIDLAKSAALKAVDTMSNGDILSIVLFDDKTTVLQPAIVLSESNRTAIKIKINNIQIRGGTNLHEGWVTAAAEASKNLGGGTLSSVLLLSDGQTLLGITDTDTIASNVAKLQKNGIMTTTFGIGEGFNEDLLQAMSNAGTGNFYYIDEDDKIISMFEDEFNGLTSVSGTDIRVSFEFENGYSVIKQMNGIVSADGNYIVSSISNKTKKALLFNLGLNVIKPKEGVKLKGVPTDALKVGKVTVSYKDENGTQRTEVVDLTNGYSTKSVWDEEDFAAEVKVQETLLIVAEQKVEATKLLDMGDFAGAQGMLRGSANYVQSMNMASDGRLMAEFDLLNKTVVSSATKTAESFRKDVSNQAYMSRNSKI